jgi:hypothetical protein
MISPCVRPLDSMSFDYEGMYRCFVHDPSQLLTGASGALAYCLFKSIVLTVDLSRFCSSSDLIVQLRVFFSGIEVVGTSRNLMDYF